MAYFAPRQPDFNYLHHLFLLGWMPDKPLTEKELRYYVSHVNEEGKSDGWFFDSFLLFNTKAHSGNEFNNDINIGTSMSGEGDFFALPSPNPGRRSDWLALLEDIIGPDGIWSEIDRTIGNVAKEIGPPPHKRNAVVTIPYPHPGQYAFGGDPNEKGRINFSIMGQNLAQASSQRLKACKWFVDETIERWEKLQPENLHLLGFYWIYESLHYSWQVDDHWVLKELYKYIRERGYKFFWIPFYSSFNVNILSSCTEFYFDGAMLQPNHMFYENIDDVEKAALEARERGAGVEMEYYPYENSFMKTMEDRHRRFRNYLNGGVKYGYMKDSVCGYFCGFNDLHLMATELGPDERKVYDDHHRFVAGTYEIE
ncbi:MAG: DUF4855 domain-containing protein [Candidatus Sumerlaeia bacterium]|nr:DUF4855 domain-containing protein [Candidatus Sumerlaeia bacterium]